MGLSLSGLVGGGMAGAGQAGQEVAQSQIDFGNKLNLAQAMSDMEVQKTRLIDQSRIDMANQQRTAEVNRIGAAKGGLIDAEMSKKYGQSDAAVAAADAGQTDAPLTAEQRGIIGQAKDADRTALDNSPDMYVKAAIKTGDIAPKDVMNTTSRQDIAQMKAENQANIWQMRIDELQRSAIAKDATAQDRIAAQVQIAEMKGMMKAQANSGAALDLKGTLGYLHSLDADIRANSQALSGLQRSSKDVFDPKEKEALQAQMLELQNDTRDKQRMKARVAKMLPGLPDDEPAKAPAAKQPGNIAAPGVSSKADYDKLPSGSVFTAPDGSRRVKP